MWLEIRKYQRGLDIPSQTMKKIQETLTTEEDENPAWNDNIHRALSCTWQRSFFCMEHDVGTRLPGSFWRSLLTITLGRHDWPLWHHGILKPIMDPWSCYVSPTLIPKKILNKYRYINHTWILWEISGGFRALIQGLQNHEPQHKNLPFTCSWCDQWVTYRQLSPYHLSTMT